MDFATKNCFTALAAAAMSFVAFAESNGDKGTLNGAEKYNDAPALLAEQCQNYVDDAGERAVADFGLGILEGADGIFDYASDGCLEEPPPNPMYPEPMEKDALYFGGSDCGRFIPETLVMNDGVRPDVSVITQNGLADDRYVSTIRERLAGKVELPADEDVEKAFGTFVYGVQSGKIDARDALEFNGGRITVTGALAVMKINEILSRNVFRKNKGKHAMYVEESYPIGWMSDYLTPHGLVLKLNAEKSGTVSDEDVRESAEFWDWMTKRLLSSPEFASCRAESWRRKADGKPDPEHRMCVRAFARMRIAHARLYGRNKNSAAYATAVRQAVAIDPLDPETGCRYAAFLTENGLDDARGDYLGCIEKLGAPTDCRR